ncbi:MAG: CoA pyrophosphatase [Halofilum sp. (in: g-proteobacteria)]
MPRPVDCAVLVPLFTDRQGDLRLLLIRRVNRGAHAGQIALPGGRQEPGDATLAATAIRETVEETGAPANGIIVVESLPPVETFTTGFRIHPFLARIERPDDWRPEPGEVAEIIELPVTEVLRPEARRRERIAAPGLAEPAEFPCLRIGSIRIWGATWRILEPLLPRLVDPPAPS